MSGRPFSYIIKSVSAITGVPFAQLATPATTSLEILRIELGQETSETSQQEALMLVRRSTNTTLPNVAERVATEQGGPATLLAGTSITNAIGVATATGSYTASLMRWTFNALNGFLYLPVPEERITLNPSAFITLEFITAPAANTYSGHIIYQELT